jgi:hypothetical protein
MNIVKKSVAVDSLELATLGILTSRSVFFVYVVELESITAASAVRLIVGWPVNQGSQSENWSILLCS